MTKSVVNNPRNNQSAPPSGYNCGLGVNGVVPGRESRLELDPWWQGWQGWNWIWTFQFGIHINGT